MFLKPMEYPSVTLTGYEGETLALAKEQIPAVGNQPNEGFTAGSWDVTPTAGAAIMENTTYTYTYAELGSISTTVTFWVENGELATWYHGVITWDGATFTVVGGQLVLE